MNASQHDPDLIRHLESARYRALVEGDYETVADLCHPELRYTHSTGVVDSRESYLAKCLAGHYDYQRIDHPTDAITFLGDVALVFGEMRADLVAGGVAKTLDNVCLAVWRWDEDRWRLFAYQPTAKPRPAAEPTPVGGAAVVEPAR